MKKNIPFALLVTAFSLLISSCQKNTAKVNEVAPSDETKENNDADSSSNYNDPSNANSTYVEINCDDGCFVKEASEQFTRQNYKNYFANGDTTFTFLNNNNEPVYPSIFVNAYNSTGEPVESPIISRNYENITVMLNYSYANHIVIEAYTAVPSVELRLRDYSGGKGVGLNYTGSVVAYDFGTACSTPTVPGVISGLPVYEQTTGIGFLKIFGDLSSITLTMAPDVEEIYLYHDIDAFDIMSLATATNLKKIYIGPDVKQIKFPNNYTSLIEGDDKQEIDPAISPYNLERVEVDGDNPYFDSRENCGSLIETSTNTLLLGGSESVIPNGVTSIATGAFALNQKISHVHLPESVVTIAEDAFAYSSVSYIELSKCLDSIAYHAFYNCSNLSIVDFSKLSHTPRIKVSAFERSLIKDFGLYNDAGIKSFIHSNPNTMMDIMSELERYDESWTSYENRFSTTIADIPSFIYTCELHPDFVPPDPKGKEKTKINLKSDRSDERYSYYSILDPLIDDFKALRVNWRGQTTIEAGGLFNDAPTNPQFGEAYPYWKKFQKRSSYCVAVYAQMEDYEVEQPLYADLIPNFKENNQLLEQNAQDISFVKWFGDVEPGTSKPTINSDTYSNLAALENFEFADVVTLDFHGIEKRFGAIGIIDPNAFRNTGIRSITLPSTLQRIESYAFAECSNLKEINYAPGRDSSLTLSFSSYDPVFLGDTSLETVYIPNFVETDGMNVNPFLGCNSIKKFVCDASPTDNLKFVTDSYGTLCFVLKEGPNVLKVPVCPVNTLDLHLVEKDDNYKHLPIGFYSTLKTPKITINPDIISFGMYGFAYSNTKKFIMGIGDNKPMFTPFMFAYCKNLEVLDLTNYSGDKIIHDGETEGIFEGSENYKVLVATTTDKTEYANILKIDPNRIVVAA